MDIASQIDAVSRAVNDAEQDGVEVRVQTLAQSYPSPLDDVWDAVTSADRIGRWFLPVDGDLVLGGRYQLQGNAGAHGDDSPGDIATRYSSSGSA